MPAIIIHEPAPALANPTPTAQRRLDAWGPRIDWDAVGKAGKQRRDVELAPALDTAALSRQYGMANAQKPVLKVATFSAPINCNQRDYDQIAKTAITGWLKAMDGIGWQHALDQRFPPGADATPGVTYYGDRTILVYPGMYPAFDLRDQVPVLDRREMKVAAHFVFRNPKPRRIEVPPHLLAPVIAHT